MTASGADIVAIGRRIFTATDARDWAELASLIHPEAELELRSQPGKVLHGRAELETFARNVIASRVEHQVTVDTIEQLAENAVVALGRLYVTDAAGTRDSSVGWLMVFEDGLLRRSWLVTSVSGARAVLEEQRAELTPP